MAYSSDEAVDILMRVKEPICSEVPLQVMENSSFLVDLDALVHPDDCKADDLGKWTHICSPKTYISVERNKNGDILDLHITRQKRNDADFIMVVQQYLHHDKEAKYRKRISFLYDSKWARHRLALLQYYYEGDEVLLKLKQHGNSKNSSEPYVRTRPSTIQEVKETASSRKCQPREVFFESVRQKGGMEFCRSKSELPRNAKQVSNALASSTASFKPSTNQSRDILLEAMEKCKSKDGFVREVVGAPEPMAFLATDRQLKDIDLYCAQAGSFSILGVDATFNLGNFSVTPTTYRPLKIYNVRTGKPPVFLGPLLVHQSKPEPTYRYLGSAMKRFNPHTVQLKAFGTDGERALSNAFKEEFPETDHHRCFIHLRKNIEMKMSSLGILGRDQSEFLCDIFGKSVAATSYHGIVDSEDSDDFYAKLCSLEKVWNDRERVITNQEPSFYDWFVPNVSDTILTSMLKPLRQKAGLGDSLYSINDNEAENHLLKLKTEHKRVSLVTFISKSHELVKEQDALLEGAILDQGECRLATQYSHLKISPERWRRMNPTERRAYTNKAKESGPISQTPSTLSMSHKQSGITGIPESILANQFAKARRLLQMKQVIDGFQHDNIVLVASETSPKPHVVTEYKNGKFSCDDMCPAYNHSSLCSHTLAAAEHNGKLRDLLQWHKKNAVETSVTKMSTYGLDVGNAGKKPHQKKGGKKSKRPESFVTEHVDRLQSTVEVQQPVKLTIVRRDGQHEVRDGSINPYSLVFLSDHPRVTTCTGCGKRFARMADGGLFPPPDDIAITHRECRPWKDKTGILRVGKEQGVYFHVNVACVRKGNSIASAGFNGSQLHVHPIVRERLTNEHKDFLYRQLNISPEN